MNEKAEKLYIDQRTRCASQCSGCCVFWLQDICIHARIRRICTYMNIHVLWLWRVLVAAAANSVGHHQRKCVVRWPLSVTAAVEHIKYLRKKAL